MQQCEVVQQGAEPEVYFDEFGQKAWPSGVMTLEARAKQGRRNLQNPQRSSGGAAAVTQAGSSSKTAILTMSNSQLTARFAELCAQVNPQLSRTVIKKWRIVTGFRGFRGDEPRAILFSRRPPVSLYAIVASIHMYTYDGNVWDLSTVQGPVSAARAKP